MHSFNPSYVMLYLHFASAVFLVEKPHNAAYTENSCRIFQNARFARPPHLCPRSYQRVTSNPRMLRDLFRAWVDWGFGIANMGSGVIRVIEMILWGGLSMVGHDSDGWVYGELHSGSYSQPILPLPSTKE